MRPIIEMCQHCYATHYTEAERLKCEQAQQQSDRIPSPMGRGKRFADACKWCGSVHLTSADRAQCQLDNT